MRKRNISDYFCWQVGIVRAEKEIAFLRLSALADPAGDAALLHYVYLLNKGRI
jgi:hypothetical protein